MDKSNNSVGISTEPSSDDDYSDETTATSLAQPDVKSTNSNGIIMDKNQIKLKETSNDMFSFRRSLELNLRTDLSSLLKSEHNFYQKNRPITIPEEILIEECLMLLSGLKPNLVFLIDNGDVVFNSKFQLRSLNKELTECLKNVTYYSKIIFRLEGFVKNSVNVQAEYTQTYEAFSQCVIEFLKYFKKFLNSIGKILLKKEIKFTLVDFLSKLSNPFFGQLDLFDQFLIQITNDTDKQSHEKTTNLLTIIHSYLTDSYSAHRNASITSEFLMWLFAHTIRPLLTIIDSFIEDGSNLDIKHELGFKRNETIQINNPDYWTLGYEMIIKPNVKIPNFIRIIITSAFKISKHMEIIKLLGNFHKKGFIYENFLKHVVQICPYLMNHAQQIQRVKVNSELDQATNRLTLLELNARQLERKFTLKRIEGTEITPVEHLIEGFLNGETNGTEDVISLNLESSLDEILERLLSQNLEWCSTILIKNLFEKFHMFNYFEFMHSYFLYKSNEIMFVFSKKLFELIKNYEFYHENAILNNLFYNSASSVFTTTALSQKSPFTSDSVTIHYDEGKTSAVKSNMTSRLINKVSLDVNVKWPLNIIIKPQDLATYNRIFLFVLQIKQAKYDLDNLNLFEMDLKLYKNQLKKQSENPFLQNKSQNTKPPDNAKPVADSAVEDIDKAALDKMFQLRFKLIVFINNAHDLICNQIYESDEEFFNKLQSQSGIDEIIQLHGKFLAKVLKNCLLDNKQFQQILLQVFDLTLQFCDLWRRGITYFIQPILAKLVELEKNIDDLFGFVYRILSSLLNKNQQTHFQPLIASLTIDGDFLYTK